MIVHHRTGSAKLSSLTAIENVCIVDVPGGQTEAQTRKLTFTSERQVSAQLDQPEAVNIRFDSNLSHFLKKTLLYLLCF